MSGFELLSVIRTRFPGITVIVLSSEYTPTSMLPEAICDAFLAKSPNLDFELAAELDRLLKESPLRGSRPKATVAPVDTQNNHWLHHPDLPGMPTFLFC
jgi:hypothetical protein